MSIKTEENERQFYKANNLPVFLVHLMRELKEKM